MLVNCWESLMAFMFSLYYIKLKQCFIDLFIYLPEIINGVRGEIMCGSGGLGIVEA